MQASLPSASFASLVPAGQLPPSFVEYALRDGAAGVLVQSEPFLTSRRDQIAALATKHAVPVIDAYPEYVQAGGLMSYGTDLLDMYRQVGVYTGRILKGANPADLPVVLSQIGRAHV